jgi:hypothetical protein
MATAADIPLLIVSENSSSERRISPSWTIAQLKGRLEPVTGVPASCQRLSLKIGSQAAQPIEAADEESTILAAWPLQAYAEIKVGTILLLSSDVSNLLFRIAARRRSHVAVVILNPETRHKHAARNRSTWPHSRSSISTVKQKMHKRHGMALQPS